MTRRGRKSPALPCSGAVRVQAVSTQRGWSGQGGVVVSNGTIYTPPASLSHVTSTVGTRKLEHCLTHHAGHMQGLLGEVTGSLQFKEGRETSDSPSQYTHVTCQLSL